MGETLLMSHPGLSDSAETSLGETLKPRHHFVAQVQKRPD